MSVCMCLEKHWSCRRRKRSLTLRWSPPSPCLLVCLAIGCLLLLSFPLQCVMVIRSTTRGSCATTFWWSIRTTRMFSEGNCWQVRSGRGPQGGTWQGPERSSFVFTWAVTQYSRWVRKGSMHGQERCQSASLFGFSHTLTLTFSLLATLMMRLYGHPSVFMKSDSLTLNMTKLLRQHSAQGAITCYFINIYWVLTMC